MLYHITPNKRHIVYLQSPSATQSLDTKMHNKYVTHFNPG